MGINSLPLSTINTRVDLFTTSGSWVCPVGTTYAIAYLQGGGGGGASSAGDGTNGGNSSIFNITANGGPGARAYSPANLQGISSPRNSGKGGGSAGKANDGSNSNAPTREGINGAFLSGGASVTSGVSYTLIIGSGGAGSPSTSASGGNGGSGAIWVEYEVRQ